MTRPAKASTQYGDMTGTVSIDGFDGLAAINLAWSADRSIEYVPIGIRITGFPSNRNPDSDAPPVVTAKLICVDSQQTGKSPEDIEEHHARYSRLDTFEIDAEIDLNDFLSKLKRLDIVLIQKPFDRFNVQIQPFDD